MRACRPRLDLCVQPTVEVKQTFGLGRVIAATIDQRRNACVERGN